MKPLRIILITLILQILTNFWSVSPAYFQVDGNYPVPKGAKISLELDKDEYFFGEPVLFHFCLENTGKEPFSFEYGGDYRGSTRALRFKVTVKDKNGNVMTDPDVFQMNMGGLGGGLELKPNERWCESLSLSRYAYLEKPGTYSIEAYHDLGWKETNEHPLPKGKATIKMKLPDENQMKQFLKDMYTLPDKYDGLGWKWGEKSPVYADFTALAHPIYISMLLDKARQNDEKAFEAIRSIPTAEATKALITLLNNDDPEFVIKVFQWGLSQRVPDPKTQEYLDGAYSNSAYYLALKNWADEVWRDEFAEDLLNHGRKFLLSQNVTIQSFGGIIIWRLGGADDMARVISSLTKIIDKTKNESLGYPLGVNSPHILFKVFRDLVKKYGYQGSSDPKSYGEIAAYLGALRIDEAFRPQGWKNNIKKWLKHETEFIRQLAVKSLSSEVIDEVKADVVESLSDPEFGVRMAACQVVGSYDINAKDEIISSFVDIDNTFALGCWVGVAQKLGVRWEMLNVLVDGLKEGNGYCNMISSIADLLVDEEAHGSGCNSNFEHEELVKIKNRLKNFLIEHKERLKADQGFRFTDKEITSDLLFNFSYNLGDGKEWPLPSEEIEKDNIIDSTEINMDKNMKIQNDRFVKNELSKDEDKVNILQSFKVVKEARDHVIIDIYYRPEALEDTVSLLSAIPLIDGSSPGHFSVGVDGVSMGRNKGRIRIGMNSEAPDYCSNQILLELYHAREAPYETLILPYEKCWRKSPVVYDRPSNWERIKKLFKEIFPKDETVDRWGIREYPVAAVVMSGSVIAKEWLNIERRPISMNDALIGPGLDEAGMSNLEKGIVIDFHFEKNTVVNGKGADLVLLEGRFDAGAYQISTDYDDFMDFYDIRPENFLDTGERRSYFHGAYGNQGPFNARIFYSPVDLSNLGVPEDKSISTIRITVNKDGADLLGMGAVNVKKKNKRVSFLWLILIGAVAGIFLMVAAKSRKSRGKG